MKKLDVNKSIYRRFFLSPNGLIILTVKVAYTSNKPPLRANTPKSRQ